VPKQIKNSDVCGNKVDGGVVVKQSLAVLVLVVYGWCGHKHIYVAAGMCQENDTHIYIYIYIYTYIRILLHICMYVSIIHISKYDSEHTA
jgi:hypothetical protein